MYTEYGIYNEVILNSSLPTPPKSGIILTYRLYRQGSIIRYSSLLGKASQI